MDRDGESTGHSVVHQSVADSLLAAARLCSDAVASFRMADALFRDVSLLMDMGCPVGSASAGSALSVYLERKQAEFGKFRDASAVLCIDAVFGYCLIVRRALVSKTTGRTPDPESIRQSLARGCGRDELEELLQLPPRLTQNPSPHCESALWSAYQVAGQALRRVAEVAEAEGVTTLGELLAEGSTEAGEVVLDCLAPVHRYAETLHAAIRYAERRRTPTGAVPYQPTTVLVSARSALTNSEGR